MKRVIITGGGTGGHIYPAIAIANAIKALDDQTEILFVGAAGKMEMEKVPAEGYRIVGLPIAGFHRRVTLKNLLFPFKLFISMIKAWKTVRDFKPDAVAGVGGYASGPVLRVATSMGIPSLIQEQNSFPGVTNRILAKKVQKICVAYQGMEKFFPAEKILLTGNPIRKNIIDPRIDKVKALEFFGLTPSAQTLLIVGGSLGSGTINEAASAFISSGKLDGHKIQIIWQTGKFYYEAISERHKNRGKEVVIYPFIERMDLAYAASDLIVSRAGAIAISELCTVGKPVILIPSPNVAEDHQTMNARALEKAGAAIVIADRDAISDLGKTLLDTLQQRARLASLSSSIKQLAITDASEKIAREILSLIPGYQVVEKSAPTAPFIPRVVYFLGIGGIGMSALARYFASIGSKVAGYDKTATPLTKQLQQEGMEIHFTEDISKIPPVQDLVVYTPAIPSDHAEINWFRERGVKMRKRAEVLGLIAANYKTIAVAGTHGKTTTSTMIAHLLQTAGFPFMAFLGGISKNYGTNYITGKTGDPANMYCVVEADEYDRSFLQLSPDLAVITSADTDHLDIYGRHDDVVRSFEAFTGKIRGDGTLFLKQGTKISPRLSKSMSYFKYSADQEGNYKVSGLTLKDGVQTFDLHHPGGTLSGLRLQAPGKFNLENAVGAMAVGLKIGISPDKIKEAMETYEGVIRRFEFVVKTNKAVYIDDYAHHPEELRACITTARELYPGRTITGIFQPHLYSRTRDLAQGFAESLDLLDTAFLLDIYPARELPIPGVTTELILGKMTLSSKQLIDREKLLAHLRDNPPEVLITMGAGDIDQLVKPISGILQNYIR